MRKLIKYPSQALNYIEKGQLMVLMTNDVEKIAIANVYMQVIPVSVLPKSEVIFN